MAADCPRLNVPGKSLTRGHSVQCVPKIKKPVTGEKILQNIQDNG